METLLQDLRYALRTLLKSPGFTTVAVLTLALGIGANTAIFSLVNAVLLKMLPVKDPGQLVVVGDPLLVHNQSLGDPQVGLFSYPLYRELAADNQVFSSMLASSEVHRLKVARGVGTEDFGGSITGVLVSGNYFSTLGINPVLGRTITPDDDTAPGAHPVAVLSYGFWKEKLGQDPNIVGQSIRINKYPFTIVGVAPDGFFGDTVGDRQDMWVPVTMQEQVITGRAWLDTLNASWLHCVARLKPGVTVDQARANINLVLRQSLTGAVGAKLGKDDLENLKKAKIEVSAGGGGFSQLRGDFQQPLFLLMGIVGMVLVIACVNVANLLLVRATARRKEIAVRMAIGAAPGRVIRQLLTESVLLSFAGGAVGLMVAQLGTKALLGLSKNPELEASPDLRVFLFTAIVCLVTGILFGLAPALRSRRVQVALTLKSGAQNGNDSHTRWSWGKTLVTAQVALSLLVLFAAGLLVRSLQNIRTLDLGYSQEHILLVSADPQGAGYNPAQISNFNNELAARLASLPGVRAVTSSKNGLFSGSESGEGIKVEGFASKNDEDNVVAADDAGPNYFTAVGIPLILGRDIGLQDTATSPKVAVINETMAKFYFNKANPIGRRFVIDDEKLKNQPIEIIGVAHDARDHELRGPIPRRFYVPIAQATNPVAVLNFEIRAAGDTAPVAEAAHKLIQEFNPNVPVNSIRTLDQLIERTIGSEILIAELSSFFAGLALLLASIGLYGIMSYMVSGRTREIGVRMALGAQRNSVLWMILQEAAKLVAVGVVIGVPAALMGSRLLTTMLFGLRPSDPTSMVMVIGVLLVIALFAGYIPSRRATKVDPMVALRYE